MTGDQVGVQRCRLSFYFQVRSLLDETTWLRSARAKYHFLLLLMLNRRNIHYGIIQLDSVEHKLDADRYRAQGRS